MSYDIYKKYVGELVKFKSISTDSTCKKDLERTAEWLKNLFIEKGFQSSVWHQSGINPVVFASYHISAKSETVLIYGHYDVQPAEKSDGWTSDPFKLTERKGRLYARGIIDNKGQFFVHVATVFDLIEHKSLKYNVKFILEGNEETGNTELGKVFKKYKKELKSDFVLISDGEIFGDHPTIEASFRGTFNLVLKYATAKNNLHSGMYGGAVPSAAHELAKFVALLYNKDNVVNIPGFYDGMDKISKGQLENNRVLGKNIKETIAIAGVKSLLTEKGVDFFTQVGLRPTVQVTGMKSGYFGDGFSNIVPASAEAKINVRLVSSQDPMHIYEKFKHFVEKNTPKYVDYELSIHSPSRAVKVNGGSPRIGHIRSLLEKIYGTKVVIKYVGGTLPVINDFKDIIKVDPISASLANEDCNMHGVNENFRIDLLKKGLEFSKELLGK